MATTTHLLYLHGFRSSPRSAKAQAMAAHVRDHHPDVHWWCPQLPPSPREAMDMVAEGLRDWPAAQMAVIGSSLGGFYASWVAHLKSCPSVLLNPASYPDRDLERYIGEHSSWHDPETRFFFKPEYIAELQALSLHGKAPAGPELGLFAKGDELLDWREMLARYPLAEHILIEGSDHALSGFEAYIPDICDFLRLV